MHVLDGGAIRTGRELTINEDARRKVDVPFERLVIELICKGGCRHCRGIVVRRARGLWRVTQLLIELGWLYKYWSGSA